VTRRSLLRLMRLPLLFGVVPVAAYFGALAALGDDAAGIATGAVANASPAALIATALALLLRLYTVVLLPGICAYWLVIRLAKRFMDP